MGVVCLIGWLRGVALFSSRWAVLVRGVASSQMKGLVREDAAIHHQLMALVDELLGVGCIVVDYMTDLSALPLRILGNPRDYPDVIHTCTLLTLGTDDIHSRDGDRCKLFTLLSTYIHVLSFLFYSRHGSLHVLWLVISPN